jgi:UDP-N-acetylmuramoyl-tripeptide--D-alanyl-D-alanine ligase
VRARRLSEVAADMGGRVVGEDVEVSSVAVDSRAAAPGSLFFAMQGEREDGHDYVRAAFASGAAAAVVAREDVATAGPSVVVPETGVALLALATAERDRFAGRVVGITGSTGKTSTKDLLAAALGVRHRVSASRASFNNQVGVPLTVLGMDPRTEVLVAEIGASGIGEIRLMCGVARPDVAVVTNVGLAHVGRFGSRENIVRAKAELVEELPADGLAVLNADDPVVRGYAARTDAPSVLYGTAPDADVRAEDVEVDRDALASFTAVVGSDRERVELGVPGEHMVHNALAAVAVATRFEVTLPEVAAALKDARVSAWRMETFTSADGLKVVNDAYNANPTSMAAALKAARWIAGDGRCVAVLGHMAELGQAAMEEHEKVGELVARLGIDHLVVVGEEARHIARGALREGVEPSAVVVVDTPEQALEQVRQVTSAGDVVLVKGSRVAGLERLAEALR